MEEKTEETNWNDKIIDSSKQIEWDEIVGLQQAKSEVKSSFIYALDYPSLFIKKPRNMLLYGPPGTGKTYLVKGMAKKVWPRVAILAVTASDFKGKYVGETEKNLTSLFEWCKQMLRAQEINKGQMKKIIIFFDEFENIASSRKTAGKITGQTVSHLLQLIDGVKSSPNVSLVAATNLPEDLDEAILRRFAVQVFVDLPTFPARVELIAQTLAKQYNTDQKAKRPVTNYENVESDHAIFQERKKKKKKSRIFKITEGNDFLKNFENYSEYIGEKEEEEWNRDDWRADAKPEKNWDRITIPGDTEKWLRGLDEDYKKGMKQITLGDIIMLARITAKPEVGGLGLFSGSDIVKIVDNIINNSSLRAVTGKQCQCSEISLVKKNGNQVFTTECNEHDDKNPLYCKNVDQFENQWIYTTDTKKEDYLCRTIDELRKMEVKGEVKGEDLRTYSVQQCDVFLGLKNHRPTINKENYEKSLKYSGQQE